MSFHKIPIFDLLSGQDKPYEGFGEVLTDSADHEEKMNKQIVQAINRVQEGFEVDFSVDGGKIEDKIENIIKEMWDEDWDPKSSNINLFTTDFGLLLVKLIISKFGGELVFRNTNDLNHVSVWWADKEVEVFPFHKVYKRLSEMEGESIKTFITGLNHILSR